MWIYKIGIYKIHIYKMAAPRSLGAATFVSLPPEPFLAPQQGPRVDCPQADNPQVDWFWTLVLPACSTVNLSRIAQTGDRSTLTDPDTQTVCRSRDSATCKKHIEKYGGRHGPCFA